MVSSSICSGHVVRWKQRSWCSGSRSSCCAVVGQPGSRSWSGTNGCLDGPAGYFRAPATHSQSFGQTRCCGGTAPAFELTGAGSRGAARRPPSQGWKTFLRNHADGIAAMDLFVVPTVSFRLLYGLLIVEHSRRQINNMARRNGASDCGVDCQSTYAGVRLGPDAALSDPRPGCLLRDRVRPPSAVSRYSRSSDVCALALAEWLR